MQDAKSFIKFWQGIVVKKELPLTSTKFSWYLPTVGVATAKPPRTSQTQGRFCPSPRD